MPVTLPIEVYEVLEKVVGKENAKVVIKSIESTISENTEYKWKVSKDELLDVMRKEFVTKDFFEERLNTLKAEISGEIDALYEKTEKDKAELLGKIDALYEKTEKDKAELLGIMQKDKAEIMGIVEKNKLEVEKEILRIDRKFTVMFVVILFTIIFLNQNALEFIFRILGVLR